jgi:hypothetical protein
MMKQFVLNLNFFTFVDVVSVKKEDLSKTKVKVEPLDNDDFGE